MPGHARLPVQSHNPNWDVLCPRVNLNFNLTVQARNGVLNPKCAIAPCTTTTKMTTCAGSEQIAFVEYDHRAASMRVSLTGDKTLGAGAYQKLARYSRDDSVYNYEFAAARSNH